MKVTGLILLLAGILIIMYSLNMDTTVAVPNSTTWLPSQRVNNIGLMNDKQNYLIISGIVTITGVILLVFGKDKPKESVQSDVKNLN